MATPETDSTTPDSAALDSRAGRLRGIGLMCVALAMFSLLDGSAKYLSAELPTLQIVWARYVVGFLVTFIFVSPRRLWRLGKSGNIKLQLFRSAMLLGATMFNFLAVRYLQLSLTATIFFATPLLVAALAVPILGERVGVRRWAAIFVGFSGVVVVTQPWSGGLHWAIGLSVLAAISYSLYSVSTRMLARVDASETTLFFSALVGMAALTPAVPFVWVWPQGVQTWGLLVGLGVLGGVGHYLLIIAHRGAPASLLAPYTYTNIVWMTAVGFFVFGDIPAQATLIGAAIVIASGLYLFARERVAKTRVDP